MTVFLFTSTCVVLHSQFFFFFILYISLEKSTNFCPQRRATSEEAGPTLQQVNGEITGKFSSIYLINANLD